MSARKKLNKLCVQELNNNSKSYDEAFEFMKKFMCIYEKCKPDKKYIPRLSHYDFMYWVNPIREAFAENNYIKAVEKLIDTYMEQKEDKMQQLIILIVALALAGGVYLFLTISKKKSKEQTEENAVEMMTANEMINVKDIRNNCLHTNDGYTFTFIEIGGMSMELFSESEKLAYCKNITSIVSRFQFPYKYMAISSPYVIKHMVTADSNRLKNASGLCKQMLEDDINFATKMVIDDNKIDRRFFFMLFSKDEDEKTILKRTEDTINAFNSEVDGMSCELVKDKDIIKMYNLFTNPAYIAYERTDDVYLSMSQIIATNS